LGFAQVWESSAPRHFTEGEIATGQTLIHQAAITIYNAQLVGALRQYTVELETQNAELDAFAHTVAHDLKNPLTALIGFSGLLEGRFTKMSEEKLRHNLQIIGQNGRKMRNIIDELLLLASVRKVEEVETGPLDMVRITDEARGRLADPIAEQQAEIIAPDSWPVALGYGPWVEEVWVNYLSNALKYGGQPPRVELGATEQEDGAVRFWVYDNGPGLALEEQAQLFTPFTRLHQARAKGHGLGLSIVQRIVEKLGGQVGVESTPGQGSTFFFTLPAG
jgi:signal transduction histidine kinase